MFVDAVGLPYKYEKEDFVLNDGTSYLPDFSLPSLKLWVEVRLDLDFIEYPEPDGCESFGSKDRKLYSCLVVECQDIVDTQLSRTILDMTESVQSIPVLTTMS